MDRNKTFIILAKQLDVALRKESVDRNYIIKITKITPTASLSARRAWIEIDSAVDSASGTLSLSARRAWIEIPDRPGSESCNRVALRKESVDRNLYRRLGAIQHSRRSPQGERG